MKKIVILTGLLMLVASASFAAVGDMWFGVTGGAALPNGPVGSAYKTGYGGTIYGSYGVAKDCAVGIEAGVWTFKGDTNDNLTATMIPVTAFATYTVPLSDPKMRPYAKVDAGMYNVKVKLDVPAPNGFEQTDSKFGFKVGGGFDYEVSPSYTLGVTAAFESIQTDNDPFNFISVGLKLGFGMPKK